MTNRKKSVSGKGKKDRKLLNNRRGRAAPGTGNPESVGAPEELNRDQTGSSEP